MYGAHGSVTLSYFPCKKTSFKGDYETGKGLSVQTSRRPGCLCGLFSDGEAGEKGKENM